MLAFAMERPMSDDDKTVRWANPAIQAGFTMVPNVVLKHPELSNPAKLLYAQLCSYAWQAEECFPGQERLSADMRLSDRQVRTLVSELRRAGVLDSRRRGMGQTNVYVLLDPNGDQPPDGPEVDVRSDRQPTSDKEDSVEEDPASNTAAEAASAPDTEKTDPVMEVWGYWVSRRRPVRQDLEDAQRRLIQKALNTGFTVPELWKAIDGLLLSDWHRENRKLHLSTIVATRPGGPTLRDQITSWIERADGHAKSERRAGTVSADAISRAKSDVLRAWQMPRSSHAVEQGERARQLLARHGITVVRDTERNGRPQFVELDA